MTLGIIISDKSEALRSDFKGQVRLSAFSLLQLQEMSPGCQKHWATKGSPLKNGTAPTDIWDIPVELLTWPATPRWHKTSACWAVISGATQRGLLCKQGSHHPCSPGVVSASALRSCVFRGHPVTTSSLQLACSSSFALSQMGQDKRGGQKLAKR